MLTICTWRWGDKYGPHYVDRLRRGVERNLDQPFRFIVAEPEPEDAGLTAIPGCFCRLRMFDPRWQEKHNIDGPLVCLDLDLIVTGQLDGLFAGDDPFRILQGANASNPCPYNGSVMMLTPGYRPDVWWNFSVEAARRAPFYEFPDDQGWLWAKMPGAAGWRAGPTSGVYAMHKPGWPTGSALPDGAKIVCFPGKRDPKDFAGLPWVRRHWR